MTGFTSTTFRPYKIDSVVKLAKEAQAECIEWGGDIHVKTVEDAKYAKALCDKNNLAICSYGSYYTVGSADKAYWDSICKIAHTLGAKTVRVWLGKKDSEKTTADEYERIVEDAKEICRIAWEYSLIVAPECHNKTYNNKTEAFLNICKDIESENFKTYFQSKYRDISYDLDRIEKTLPYIANVHISYSEQMREQGLKRDTGYINKLLEKLKEMEYDGNYLLEYTYFAASPFFARDMSALRKAITA